MSQYFNFKHLIPTSGSTAASDQIPLRDRQNSIRPSSTSNSIGSSDETPPPVPLKDDASLFFSEPVTESSLFDTYPERNNYSGHVDHAQNSNAIANSNDPHNRPYYPPDDKENWMTPPGHDLSLDSRSTQQLPQSKSSAYNRSLPKLPTLSDPFNPPNTLNPSNPSNPSNPPGENSSYSFTTKWLSKIGAQVINVTSLNATEKNTEPKGTKDKIKEKLKDINSRSWVVWLLSFIQIVVLIAEFIKMGVLTGSPIQLKPSFNPMIGPSSYLLINMGARFVPCMHAIDGITNDSNLRFGCPNSTTIETNVCSLSELCGMGGLPDPSNIDGLVPDQWWRFVTPIFLHGGIIHIGFNLLLQISLGSNMEKDIGHVRFAIIYFASGIAGFVLGGNFAPNGTASTGASGSLFGIIALELLDLLFNWELFESPKRAIGILVIEIIVSFGIGLLPGLDNFSHIGGFCMGLLLGIVFLQSPLPIRKRQLSAESKGSSYISKLANILSPKEKQGRHPVEAINMNWLKNPKQHFKGRPFIWYCWVLARLTAFSLAIAYFVVLIYQFEHGGGHCSWCKYLSCLPVNGWCDIGNLTTTPSSNQSGYLLLSFLFLRLFIKDRVFLR